MDDIKNYEIEQEPTIIKVKAFLGLKTTNLQSKTIKSAIKELCVIRLCRSIGLSGHYNYKSDFFEFFSSIVGEAISEHLSLKISIACDELRLVKYEHINLIQQVKQFFQTKSVEEAFLDAFELIDKFKYLILELKKR